MASSSLGSSSAVTAAAAKKFSNDFSKAIADALLERDNATNSNSTTTTMTTTNRNGQQQKDQLIRDAYVALCYDDPRVESDEACRLLAQELLRSRQSCSSSSNINKNQYALSERLVEGIRQATRRFDVGVQQQQVQVQSQQHHQIQNDTVNSNTALTTITGATAVGYSILAMAVFCQIPLKCCHATTLREVQEWLGSYRGPSNNFIESNTTPASGTIDDSTMRMDVQTKLKSLNLLDNEDVQPPPDVDEPPTPSHHDDTEIWAEESDGSDFVYESDAVDWTAWYNHDTDDGNADAMLLGMTIDPNQLSQPIYSDDWSHVQNAVSNLLQNLTHEIFFPLPTTLWNQYHVSDQLTQLTLVLLLEGGDSSNANDDNTNNHSTNKMMTDGMLQKWSIQPINVLRDRVLIDMDSRCLQDYLSLVQSLIAAVDVATEQQQSHCSAPKGPVAIASMVGLASLSSLCSQAKQLKEIPIIRKCVLESCEDLCSLVERVSQSIEVSESFKTTTTTTTIAESTTNATSITPPSWVSTIWTLLPLLEIIANIQADGTMLDSSRYTSIPAASDSQWLLNSGFFRALILLYTKTAQYSSVSLSSNAVAAATSLSVDTARHQLLQCLQMLCLQNMSLLGKYAWRVPELNTLIHEVDYQIQHVVDGLIWSLMGQQLGAATSTQGTLRLRNNASTTSTTIFKKPVTADESKETAQSQWQLLCDQVLKAIQTIGELRQSRSRHNSKVNTNVTNQSSNNNNHDWKHPILEFTRFTNCLVSCDALSPLWRQAMLSQPNDLMKKQLEQLQKAISDLPPPPVAPKESSTSSSSSTTVTKTSDNDKAGTPLERPIPSFEAEVGMIRRAVKVATMSLTQPDEASTRRGLASKTD